MTAAFLTLDLPAVTEWLPEHDKLPAEVNDAWIEREQALRWEPGQDRDSFTPVDRPFTTE